MVGCFLCCNHWGSREVKFHFRIYRHTVLLLQFILWSHLTSLTPMMVQCIYQTMTDCDQCIPNSFWRKSWVLVLAFLRQSFNQGRQEDLTSHIKRPLSCSLTPWSPQGSNKKLQPFFKDFSRATLDFQGLVVTYCIKHWTLYVNNF